jgi:hypothetical protein
VTSRPVIQAIIAIAVIVWAAGLTLQGVAVDSSWLRWFGLAVGAATLVLMAFDRWLWRLPPVRRATGRADLSGTWGGEFRSTWADGTTPAVGQPREAYLVVRQTYSKISVCLLTEESHSNSIVASLESPKEQAARLTYTYTNVPRLLMQDRSRIHHGSAFLDVHGAGPDLLEGCYWTSRDTKGELRFDQHLRRLHTEFLGARAAFATSA